MSATCDAPNSNLVSYRGSCSSADSLVGCAYVCMPVLVFLVADRLPRSTWHSELLWCSRTIALNTVHSDSMMHSSRWKHRFRFLCLSLHRFVHIRGHSVDGVSWSCWGFMSRHTLWLLPAHVYHCSCCHSSSSFLVTNFFINLARSA